MKQWSEEHCAGRPEKLQTIAPGLYIQRRNIKEVQHEADEVAGTDAYTEFVCESREITESEYAMLESIEQISTEKAIDAFTMQLIEEGVL